MIDVVELDLRHQQLVLGDIIIFDGEGAAVAAYTLIGLYAALLNLVYLVLWLCIFSSPDFVLAVN